MDEGLARRVLVVDDNSDAADTLATIIQSHGYEVRVAYSGEEALLLAMNFLPDVVLLDLAMPELNGFSVARELRNRPESNDALIVAVTGYGLPADRARCEAAGFDTHVLKPIDIEKLNELLQNARHCS